MSLELKTTENNHQAPNETQIGSPRSPRGRKSGLATLVVAGAAFTGTYLADIGPDMSTVSEFLLQSENQRPAISFVSEAKAHPTRKFNSEIQQMLIFAKTEGFSESDIYGDSLTRFTQYVNSNKRAKQGHWRASSFNLPAANLAVANPVKRDVRGRVIDEYFAGILVPKGQSKLDLIKNLVYNPSEYNLDPAKNPLGFLSTIAKWDRSLKDEFVKYAEGLGTNYRENLNRKYRTGLNWKLNRNFFGEMLLWYYSKVSPVKQSSNMTMSTDHELIKPYDNKTTPVRPTRNYENTWAKVRQNPCTGDNLVARIKTVEDRIRAEVEKGSDSKLIQEAADKSYNALYEECKIGDVRATVGELAGIVKRRTNLAQTIKKEQDTYSARQKMAMKLSTFQIGGSGGTSEDEKVAGGEGSAGFSIANQVGTNLELYARGSGVAQSDNSNGNYADSRVRGGALVNVQWGGGNHGPDSVRLAGMVDSGNSTRDIANSSQVGPTQTTLTDGTQTRTTKTSSTTNTENEFLRYSFGVELAKHLLPKNRLLLQVGFGGMWMNSSHYSNSATQTIVDNVINQSQGTVVPVSVLTKILTTVNTTTDTQVDVDFATYMPLLGLQVRLENWSFGATGIAQLTRGEQYVRSNTDVTTKLGDTTVAVTVQGKTDTQVTKGKTISSPGIPMEETTDIELNQGSVIFNLGYNNHKDFAWRLAAGPSGSAIADGTGWPVEGYAYLLAGLTPELLLGANAVVEGSSANIQGIIRWGGSNGDSSFESMKRYLDLNGTTRVASILPTEISRAYLNNQLMNHLMNQGVTAFLGADVIEEDGGFNGQVSYVHKINSALTKMGAYVRVNTLDSTIGGGLLFGLNDTAVLRAGYQATEFEVPGTDNSIWGHQGGLDLYIFGKK